MKKFYCLLFSTFIIVAASSQNVDSILIIGDKLRDNGEFFDALKKYEAAAALDPSKSAEVSVKRNSLFDKISGVAGNNKKAKAQIKKLLDTIQYQKEVISAALTKAENLINAFYFYEGRLALAYKNGKFGFIDPSGKAQIAYRYETADQFDYTGFARVQDIQEFGIPNSIGQKTEYRPVDYLIDTNDIQYKVVYRLEDLEENEEIIEPEKILAVDLRNKQWLSFPPIIKDHPDLNILIIDGKYNKENNLKNITSDLSSFTKLKFLYLQYCKLDSLPIDIGKIDSLQSLSLKGNNLKALPESFTQLKEIKKLNLVENEIGSLPDNFGQLKNLRSLLLTDNPIKNLPAGFSELSSLEILSLSRNSFSGWPAGLEKLTWLKHLNYSNNSLSYFPTQLLSLKNLETLDLSFNPIHSLLPGINTLVKLKTLDLSRNELSTLPAGFGKLKNIESLDLSGNNIVAFPKEILMLKNLNKLDLSFNRSLNSIPKEIKDLKMLRELRLNNTSIPESERQKIRSWLPACKVIFMQYEG